MDWPTLIADLSAVADPGLVVVGVSTKRSALSIATLVLPVVSDLELLDHPAGRGDRGVRRHPEDTDEQRRRAGGRDASAPGWS